MQKKIELIFKLITCLIFFVPLLFFPSDFIFPFIVPKILTFRSLVLVLLGLYILLLSLDFRRYAPKRTKLNIIILLFTISFGVSTFLGQDWYRSFWDNHERMLGFFTVIHFVLFYFMLTSVVRSWNDWKWLLRTFLLAGGIVMFIALIQQFRNDFMYNTSGNRSASTLGNPIYVGGYGLFLACMGFFMSLKEDDMFWKIFVGIVGILGFLGVFFSGSRGALLGLSVAIVVGIISYIFTLKKQVRVRKTLISLIVVGIILAGSLYGFRKTEFVSNIPTIGRLLNSTVQSVSTRIMAWDIAIEGFKDHPIIGWGPSNYYFAFNKYYRAEFLRYGYTETWFDNAHNIVLNTLTERGVVGFVIYISIFLVTIFQFWFLYKNKKYKVDIHLLTIVTVFLLAHLMQTISVFDNPTSYLYLFFFLALTNSMMLSVKDDEVLVENKTSKPLSIPIMAVTGIFVLLMIYSTNINPARANMATLDTLHGLYRLEDNITSLYQKASSIPSPHIDDIRNDVSRTISSALRQYVGAGKPQLAQELFQLAYGELNKNLELHPLDLRVYSQQVLLLQEAAALSKDKKLIEEAEKIMEQALSMSEERQQFIYILAGLKVQLGKSEEAEALYRSAIEHDEKISESWWRLALLYGGIYNDTEGAIKIIEEATSRGILFGPEGKAVIANILQKHEQKMQENQDSVSEE
jgi:O-antigen ligase